MDFTSGGHFILSDSLIFFCTVHICAHSFLSDYFDNNPLRLPSIVVIGKCSKRQRCRSGSCEMDELGRVKLSLLVLPMWFWIFIT